MLQLQLAFTLSGDRSLDVRLQGLQSAVNYSLYIAGRDLQPQANYATPATLLNVSPARRNTCHLPCMCVSALLLTLHAGIADLQLCMTMIWVVECIVECEQYEGVAAFVSSGCQCLGTTCIDKRTFCQSAVCPGSAWTTASV